MAEPVEANVRHRTVTWAMVVHHVVDHSIRAALIALLAADPARDGAQDPAVTFPWCARMPDPTAAAGTGQFSVSLHVRIRGIRSGSAAWRFRSIHTCINSVGAA